MDRNAIKLFPCLRWPPGQSDNETDSWAQQQAPLLIPVVANQTSHAAIAGRSGNVCHGYAVPSFVVAPPSAGPVTMIATAPSSAQPVDVRPLEDAMRAWLFQMHAMGVDVSHRYLLLATAECSRSCSVPCPSPAWVKTLQSRFEREVLERDLAQYLMMDGDDENMEDIFPPWRDRGGNWTAGERKRKGSTGERPPLSQEVVPKRPREEEEEEEEEVTIIDPSQNGSQSDVGSLPTIIPNSVVSTNPSESDFLDELIVRGDIEEALASWLSGVRASGYLISNRMLIPLVRQCATSVANAGRPVKLTRAWLNDFKAKLEEKWMMEEGENFSPLFHTDDQFWEDIDGGLVEDDREGVLEIVQNTNATHNTFIGMGLNYSIQTLTNSVSQNRTGTVPQEPSSSVSPVLLSKFDALKKSWKVVDRFGNETVRTDRDVVLVTKTAPPDKPSAGDSDDGELPPGFFDFLDDIPTLKKNDPGSIRSTRFPKRPRKRKPSAPASEVSGSTQHQSRPGGQFENGVEERGGPTQTPDASPVNTIPSNLDSFFQELTEFSQKQSNPEGYAGPSEGAAVVNATALKKRHRSKKGRARDPMDNIFYLDKFSLYHGLLPEDVANVTGMTCDKGEHSEARLSVLACTNFSGTERLRLLVVGRETIDPPLPVFYQRSERSWITPSTFAAWLLDVDRGFRQRCRFATFLMDKDTVNRDLPASLSNIKLVYLSYPQNCDTNPFNCGIVRNLKMMYRRRVLDYLMEPLQNEAQEMNLRVAVAMLASTWADFPTRFIPYFFSVAGFRPYDFQYAQGLRTIRKTQSWTRFVTSYLRYQLKCSATATPDQYLSADDYILSSGPLVSDNPPLTGDADLVIPMVPIDHEIFAMLADVTTSPSSSVASEVTSSTGTTSSSNRPPTDTHTPPGPDTAPNIVPSPGHTRTPGTPPTKKILWISPTDPDILVRSESETPSKILSITPISPRNFQVNASSTTGPDPTCPSPTGPTQIWSSMMAPHLSPKRILTPDPTSPRPSHPSPKIPSLCLVDSQEIGPGVSVPRVTEIPTLSHCPTGPTGDVTLLSPSPPPITIISHSTMGPSPTGTSDPKSFRVASPVDNEVLMSPSPPPTLLPCHSPTGCSTTSLSPLLRPADSNTLALTPDLPPNAKDLPPNGTEVDGPRSAPSIADALRGIRVALEYLQAHEAFARAKDPRRSGTTDDRLSTGHRPGHGQTLMTQFFPRKS